MTMCRKGLEFFHPAYRSAIVDIYTRHGAGEFSYAGVSDIIHSSTLQTMRKYEYITRVGKTDDGRNTWKINEVAEKKIKTYIEQYNTGCHHD